MTAAELKLALSAASAPPLVRLDPGGRVRYRLHNRTPPALARRFALLRTGVAAIVLGRVWVGRARKDGMPRELDPAGLLPPDIGVVAVVGGGEWDDLPPDAVADFPELFAPAPGPTRRQSGKRPVVTFGEGPAPPGRGADLWD